MLCLFIFILRVGGHVLELKRRNYLSKWRSVFRHIVYQFGTMIKFLDKNNIDFLLYTLNKHDVFIINLFILIDQALYD